MPRLTWAYMGPTRTNIAARDCRHQTCVNSSVNNDNGLHSRTRDPALLDTCDIVVDVGAVYDVAKKRFDHHQNSFQVYEKDIMSAGKIIENHLACLPSC